MKTMFVQRIEEAMRPLLGIVHVDLIHSHGLQAAYAVYDQLVGNSASGIPIPIVTPKFQACAQALAEALKNLEISYKYIAR